MKLAIFSPVTRTSSIGGVTSLVVRALVSRGHQVTVVRTESETFFSEPTHDYCSPVIRWDKVSAVQSCLKDAEIAVYQIGNYYDFHKGCLEWLPSFPGIVCLHDFFIGHLFWGWSDARRDEARAVLSAWYGETIASSYFNFSNGEEFIAGTRDSAPLTEWICSMADGVVTHSNWGIPRVLSSCPGPVHVIPLCHNKDIKSIPTEKEAQPGKGGLHLLTIGHINPNKRVSSVIRAIGSSEILRTQTVYRLTGKIEPTAQRELEQLAKDLSVRLMISGEVDDATLQQHINEADAMCCLRWPALEAASGSLVEALLNRKPTIVTDTGFFSEIPSSCVLKIDPTREVDSIGAALELLCNDAAVRETLGQRGGEWASGIFSPEGYAQNLIDIATSIKNTTPIAAALNFFEKTLTGWGASGELLCLEDTTAPLRIFENRGLPPLRP